MRLEVVEEFMVRIPFIRGNRNRCRNQLHVWGEVVRELCTKVRFVHSFGDRIASGSHKSGTKGRCQEPGYFVVAGRVTVERRVGEQVEYDTMRN